MFQGHVHRSIHDDRIREMRSRAVEAQRRDDARAWSASRQGEPRSVRRSIGRSIVRVGRVIAQDPQPVISR
jgi:hypothetical protein